MACIILAATGAVCSCACGGTAAACGRATERGRTRRLSVCGALAVEACAPGAGASMPAWAPWRLCAQHLSPTGTNKLHTWCMQLPHSERAVILRALPSVSHFIAGGASAGCLLDGVAGGGMASPACGTMDRATLACATHTSPLTAHAPKADERRPLIVSTRPGQGQPLACIRPFRLAASVAAVQSKRAAAGSHTRHACARALAQMMQRSCCQRVLLCPGMPFVAATPACRGLVLRA